MHPRKFFLVLLAIGSLAIESSAAADAQAPAPTEKVRTTEISNWDVAFGASYVTDYNFRGISQSARGGSLWGYAELRYDLTKDFQWYAAVGVETIRFPNRSPVELDLYGGVRPRLGALSFDIGFWYYAYPGGTTFNGLGPSPATCSNGFFTPTGACNVVKGDLSFGEVFAKTVYALSDQLSVGVNIFHAPNWLNSGAFGTYGAATAKIGLPPAWLPKDWNSHLSGELGRYWFGVTDAFYGVPAFPNGVKYPDYTTWNVGLAFTYKILTLDLRYFDTTLSPAECNIITSDHTATFNAGAITPANPSGLVSKWCGAAYVARISFDTTLSDLKK
jgi:uncharacterized protein (TIGR02001 family)